MSNNGNNLTPQSPVGDGRNSAGRFAAGNKAGRGNPHNQRAQQIRAALFEAVDPEAIRDAVRAVVELARTGDLKALEAILDRTIGKPVPGDLEERLTALEQAIEERASQ